MANRLDTDLTDKVVVIDKRYLKAEFHSVKARLFQARGGFGCQPETIGNAVIGTFLSDGEEARIEGFMVERFATPEEVESL